MQRFVVGDTLRGLQATLLDGNNNAVDVSGNTIVFRMIRRTDGTVKVNNASAAIINGPTGTVAYTWATPDVDEAGYFIAWFIRSSGGAVEHFPADHSFVIRFVVDTLPTE